MKIKTVQELDKVLTDEFNAMLSSVEEVNKYEHYSLVGDNEQDYSKLYKVYKIEYKESVTNPYDVIFILVFSKNGGIYKANADYDSSKDVAVECDYMFG